MITVDAIGCFEGEEDEEEVEVADEEQAGSGATLQVLHSQRLRLCLNSESA